MTAIGGDRCLLDESSLPPPYSEIPGVVPLHTGRWSGPPPSYDDVVNPDGQSFPPLKFSIKVTLNKSAFYSSPTVL